MGFFTGFHLLNLSLKRASFIKNNREEGTCVLNNVFAGAQLGILEGRGFSRKKRAGKDSSRGQGGRAPGKS